MGFSIVNHANNHALDMGEKGILATLDVWAAIPGISCLGARQSAEKEPVIVTKNNISLGFLAYTFSTNGLPLPKDKPWLVSLVERKTMAEEIDALRPLCDFLVVSMHWGDEYAREPSAAQISLAGFLAEHNVDLVIGHHPHVLQRFDSLPRPDGKKMLCFYSLGNFVSNQDRRETLLGGVLYAKFQKDGTALSIVDEGIIPVVTHYEPGYTKTRVIPLYEYGNELAEKHRHYSPKNGIDVAYFHSLLSGLNTEIKLRNPFPASGDDNP
jgi:poly-gamma-glutamate synthesis protein (capsule biosynthesis protein)